MFASYQTEIPEGEECQGAVLTATCTMSARTGTSVAQSATTTRAASASTQKWGPTGS